MRKSGLLLGAFLIASALVQAQEHYVEVTVKDTLMVEPKEWYYYIKVNESYGDMDATVTTVDTVEYTPTTKTKAASKTKTLPPPPPPQPKLPTRDEKLEELKKLIAANGGVLLPYTSLKDYFTGLDKYMMSTFSRLSLDDDYGLHIRFTSRDSLQQFLTAIRTNEDVEGGVLRISHPQLLSHYDALDAKLVEAGRQKAGRLAQLAGRRLGAITQIAESPDATKNVLEDLFERFVTLMGSKSYSSQVDREAFLSDKIKIEKTLKFRFAFQ